MSPVNKKIARTAVKFSGFGGQGIILSARVFGVAVAIMEGRNATFTQSYGPEARGGACSAEVIASDAKIVYPFVEKADVLVTLSQTAYDKYLHLLKEDGILIYEADMVKRDGSGEGVKAYDVPATAIAERLGNKIIANVVMLGFFTAVTGITSEESMLKAIAGSVPNRFLKLNLTAFKAGKDYALERYPELVAT